MSVKSGKEGNQNETKEINLTEFMGKARPHLISIDPVSVPQAIKTSQSNSLELSTLNKFENYLQVTIINRLLVYDLNEDKPLLVNEQEAMDQLLDPQLYVESGMQVAVMQKKISYKGHRGYGQTYGLKLALNSSKLGNVVLFT